MDKTYDLESIANCKKNYLGKKVKLKELYLGDDNIKYEYGIIVEILSVQPSKNYLNKELDRYLPRKISLYLFDGNGVLYGYFNKSTFIPNFVDFNFKEVTVINENM